MIAQIFRTAMTAPARQAGFRRRSIAHLVFLAIAVGITLLNPRPETLQFLGYALLGVAIVEGAVLLGWRLTQLPKSQALEFMLTSPVSARRLFLAESAVGLSRFVLIQLSGAPVLFALVSGGIIKPLDLALLVFMPMIWGGVAATGLIVWAYETRVVRRIGEMVTLFGILVYLALGVLAGERLKSWLDTLPGGVSDSLFDAFRALHTYNPFGIMQFWFDPQFVVPVVARERAIVVACVGLLATGVFFLRGMMRLKGHFHDRHYRPISSERITQTERIGDRPLSWWAVRRVMEYSGRINIWLAGGFGIVYSAYLLAGNSWPAWMGQTVFHIFERMGGAPALVTGLVVLAAVPAAFQYGLWDSTAMDRCRRLELLLLTNLSSVDYWHASLSAAWRRGRGYMTVAAIVLVAMLISGRVSVVQAASALASATLLWSFSFAIGFATFSSGRQANGLGTFLTLGTPLIAAGLIQTGVAFSATLVPPGAIYMSLTSQPSLGWLPGPLVVGIATLAIARRSLSRCDVQLRAWYDRNQGLQPSAV